MQRKTIISGDVSWHCQTFVGPSCCRSSLRASGWAGSWGGAGQGRRETEQVELSNRRLKLWLFSSSIEVQELRELLLLLRLPKLLDQVQLPGSKNCSTFFKFEHPNDKTTFSPTTPAQRRPGHLSTLAQRLIKCAHRFWRSWVYVQVGVFLSDWLSYKKCRTTGPAIKG